MDPYRKIQKALDAGYAVEVFAKRWGILRHRVVTPERCEYTDLGPYRHMLEHKQSCFDYYRKHHATWFSNYAGLSVVEAMRKYDKNAGTKVLHVNVLK